MKKIIALCGAGNTGKSSTLRIAHRKLSSLSENNIQEWNVSGVDLRDISITNGVKVGIETESDPNGRLSSSLKLFKKYDCSWI